MSSKSLPIEMFNYIMSFIPPSPVLEIIKDIHAEWNFENKCEEIFGKRDNRKYRIISFYKYYFELKKEIQKRRDEIIKNDDFLLQISGHSMEISVKWHYLMRLEKKRLMLKLEELNIKTWECNIQFEGYIDIDAINQNKPHRKCYIDIDAINKKKPHRSNYSCYYNNVKIEF